MDNYTFQQNQSASSNLPPITPAQPFSSGQPELNPALNQLMSQPTSQPPVSEKNFSSLIKTIAIIVLSLIAATFIGLFIWMLVQYNDASTDLEGKINAAVAEAKDTQATELEKEFLNREKYPLREFSGPEDYGHLSFKHPKTWSVFVNKDATKGGDFEAYLNPGEVSPIADTTVNALRVKIIDKSFDAVAAEYQKEINRKGSTLKVESTTINNVSANRYTGTLPGSELNGIVVIFKIRDKTAVIQTDTILFQEDFDALIGTITFNA